MSDTLAGFAFQIIYLFRSLTVSDVLDMVAVAAIFMIVFQALHRTRALQLLRGALIVVILGVAVLIIFPLSTLGWLIRGILLAGLIAMPILFQAELRNALTGLGQIGRKRSYETEFEKFKVALSLAIKNMSAQNQGALIVLEGQSPLDDIVVTGIPIDASRITAELIQTIFFPNTPLHDGALVMRGDQILAAGCILPVETEKTGEVHLGTRHRAALGLSTKVPDALVLVVSEETGKISVSQAGQFYMGLSMEQLESWLDRFRFQLSKPVKSPWQWLKGGGLTASLTNIGVAIMLSVLAWLSVTYQTNPPKQVLIENIPVVVSGPDAGLLVMSELPEIANVQLQTTEDRVKELSSANVKAEIHLDGLTSGENRLSLQVILPDQTSQILWVKPTNVTVKLEEEVTKIFTPTVNIVDLERLPLGFSIAQIGFFPETIQVRGPKSQIEKISEVRLDISVKERQADFQEAILPQLLTISGEEVTGVVINPESVLATVPIRSGFFSKVVPVQADLISRSLDQGYEIRSIEVSPATVTLAGDRTALNEAGEFVSTIPISLTNVTSELTITSPLVVPAGVTALNQNGEPVLDIAVKVEVGPVTSYLALDKNIEFRSLGDLQVVKQSASSVSVLIIGPKPLLDELRQKPELIIVYLDFSGYSAGVYTLSLSYDAPPDLQILFFPSDIQVELKE